MKKKFTLAVLPALMVLAGCSGASQPQNNYYVEDTLMHEEIFGELPNLEAQAEEVPARKELPASGLWTPVLGFQSKDNGNGTSSIRIVAAIQSTITTATWTRCVHTPDGAIKAGKGRADRLAHTFYERLNNDTKPTEYANTVAEQDEGSGATPFAYYAVYCLLNIPSSDSAYYVDTFITVTDGEHTTHSKVGSVNVADSTKKMAYSIDEGSRYVAEINGALRESTEDPESGDLFRLSNIKFAASNTLAVLYIDATNLKYIRYGYDSLNKSYADFGGVAGGLVTVTHAGTYDIRFNDANKIHFNKMVYFGIVNGSWDWEGNLKIHCFGGEGTTTWPGVDMTYSHKNEYGQNYYKYSADLDLYTTVVFNKNGSYKTVDIGITGENNAFYPNNETDDEGKLRVNSFNY